MLTSKDSVERLMHTLLKAGSLAGLGDAQLVRRLSSASEGAAHLAFATLVERHGPMVLRICRRMLRDPNDAYDAFQATFLVLLRRSATLRRPEAIASWLHGVALRAALRLQREASRRRRRELALATSKVASVELPADGDAELGRALHEEIASLPSGARHVVVMCELEGRTYHETAEALGLPVGTVKSRLHDARRKLRSRLARRGFAPAVVTLALATSGDAASVAIPLALRELTLEAARVVAAGSTGAAPELVSASVASLVEGVTKTMTFSKFKVLSIAASAVIVTGAIAWAQGFGGQNQDPANNDRIQSLERKIDRLIDAIERTTPSTAYHRVPVVMAKTASGDLAPSTKEIYTAQAGNDPFAGGSGALEQRLSNIELRLARLEQIVTTRQALKQGQVQPDPRQAELYKRAADTYVEKRDSEPLYDKSVTEPAKAADVAPVEKPAR